MSWKLMYAAITAIFLILLIGCCIVIFGEDSKALKTYVFLLQAAGTLIPLISVIQIASQKIGEFKPRKPVRDSYSTSFDLRRNIANKEWRLAMESEKQILDLKYICSDLEDRIEGLEREQKSNEIFFRLIWDNLDYINTYSPVERARKQVRILVGGALVIMTSSFLSLFDVEFYKWSIYLWEAIKNSTINFSNYLN